MTSAPHLRSLLQQQVDALRAIHAEAFGDSTETAAAAMGGSTLATAVQSLCTAAARLAAARKEAEEADAACVAVEEIVVTEAPKKQINWVRRNVRTRRAAAAAHCEPLDAIMAAAAAVVLHEGMRPTAPLTQQLLEQCYAAVEAVADAREDVERTECVLLLLILCCVVFCLLVRLFGLFISLE